MKIEQCFVFCIREFITDVLMLAIGLLACSLHAFAKIVFHHFKSITLTPRHIIIKGAGVLQVND